MGLLGIGRRRARESPVRLFYASDIHGTEVLWRKFLNAAKAYGADVLVMGGDLTGKAVIPLVGTGDTYEVELFGERRTVSGEDQLAELERQIRGKGCIRTGCRPTRCAGSLPSTRKSVSAGSRR